MDKLYKKILSPGWDRKGEIKEFQEAVPEDSLIQGIEEFLTEHPLGPTISYKSRTPNPEYWQEGIGVFRQEFGIESEEHTRRALAERLNRNYGVICDQSNTVLDAVRQLVVPQLVRKGTYETPWSEDETFINLQELQRHMGIDRFRRVMNTYEVSNEEFSRERTIYGLNELKGDCLDPHSTIASLASYLHGPQVIEDLESLQERRTQLEEEFRGRYGIQRKRLELEEEGRDIKKKYDM